MHPLRIAILWHQHQPDYRVGGTMALPWVRLHGAKDYTDLIELASATPSVHQTVNVVPSLLEQLDAYADGWTDDVWELVRLPSDTLTEEQRNRIVHWVTKAPRPRMIAPFPRLVGLLDTITRNAGESFTPQDWRDLVVLYQCSWLRARTQADPAIAHLCAKGAGYTDVDKLAVLGFHRRRMAAFVPAMRKASTDGWLEVSVSPRYHPILPLLIDTDTALACGTEHLPSPALRAPDEARRQVDMAIADLSQRGLPRPRGMWPPEGSVSMAALTTMVEQGITWTATDAAILRRTMGAAWTPAAAWLPWTVATPAGPMAILFRDRDLSDAIGFTYAEWSAEAAVDDFMRRLDERRRSIVATYGASMLAHAVVPIMLDGENCWEFYRNNGEDFLGRLFRRLAGDASVRAVTCSEAVAGEHATVMAPLSTLAPGSWIDGTFDVWIGSASKNAAWEALREAVELVAASGAHPAVRQAHDELLKAEGSDTFWWYDDRHQAEDKFRFDDVFRERLRRIHTLLDRPVPPTLSVPFHRAQDDHAIRRSFRPLASTMQTVTGIVRDGTLHTNGAWQRLTVRLFEWPARGTSVDLRMVDPSGTERWARILDDRRVIWRPAYHDEGYEADVDGRLSFYVHAQPWWTLTVVGDDGSETTIALSVGEPA